MYTLVVLDVVVFTVALVVTTTNALQYHGILMNGAHGGTQFYDPFNTPHAQGNLQLGLQPRNYAQGGAVINGQLAYFASGLGGTSFLEYNTATNKTRALAPIPQWRQLYGMTTLDSGNVLLCGGASTNESFLSTCMLYNTAANAWTAFASMPVAITNFPMITLNGCPFVFGGWSGVGVDPLNTVYAFDMDKGAWSGRAHMEMTLAFHSAVAMNNTTALVCGGLPSGDANLVQSACYTYSLIEDLWTLAAPMNTARLGHCMAMYKGRVLVYGGEDMKGTMLSSVEMLSLDGQAWQTQSTSMFRADSIFASVPMPA